MPSHCFCFLHWFLPLHCLLCVLVYGYAVCVITGFKISEASKCTHLKVDLMFFGCKPALFSLKRVLAMMNSLSCCTGFHASLKGLSFQALCVCVLLPLFTHQPGKHHKVLRLHRMQAVRSIDCHRQTHKTTVLLHHKWTSNAQLLDDRCGVDDEAAQ